MSIFGNAVFVQSVDIAVTASGQPAAPPLETKAIVVIGGEEGITGSEEQYYNTDTAISIASSSPWAPATAAMMQSIGSGIGTPMEVLSNPFKNNMIDTNDIQVMGTKRGSAQVTPDTAIIEIGADISFHRTTDTSVSGFSCPGMESTGDFAGGGGQGRLVYDVRYKRNLIRF